MFIGDFVDQPAAAPPSEPSPWRWGEDKIFERALQEFPENTPHRWETIAAGLPGRSAAEVRKHFEALEKDLDDIEAGRIPLPAYPDDLCQGWGDSWSSRGKHGGEPDRKKGVPWSEEEHRLFLIGLDKYGKGDWRSISRNVVITRTPTQVASHAQKYFLRQNLSIRNDRKRSSIHDITTANHTATNPSHPPSQPSPSPRSLAGGCALPLQR